MWTSKQSKQSADALPAAADMGVVTSGGALCGVYMGTERRWLGVLGPGGCRWRPKVGQQVLVLKTGQQEEDACILAAQQEENVLQPGEVELYADGCGIKLTRTGTVELTGQVLVNGIPLQTMIRQALAELAAQEG